MQIELILFAKTPLPGRVKTRLVPDLGEQGAAGFAEALIEASVQRAVDAWPGAVQLQAWPDPAHPCFQRLARRYKLPLSRQARGDLGAKMFQALDGASRRGAAAAVMGCDVPQCPTETFRAAHAFVSQGRAVIGPSTDGGYYFIGINPPHPACFRDIEWGGKTVYDTTLKRAADAGIDLIVLQQLQDIDTTADIEAVRATHPDLVAGLEAHDQQDR